MLSNQEIRQLGNKEMIDELTRSRRELLKSQFDVRNGTSKEVHMVKSMRRYVARLETISKEMKMEMKPLNLGKADNAGTETATPAKEEKKTVAGKTPAKKTAVTKKAAGTAKTTKKKAATSKK